MAIYEDLKASRISIDKPWEGQSGKVVEDAITKAVLDVDAQTIISAEYNAASAILTLNKKNADPVTAEVTVIPPTYNYGIKIFGIKIGDNNSIDEGSIIVSNNTTIKLLIGTYGTIQTTGEPKDKGGQVNAVITYESTGGKTSMSTKLGLMSKDSFKYDTNNNIIGINEGVSLIELDVTQLFNTYQSNGTISAKIIPNASEEVDPVEDALLVTITCEIPILKYTSDIYTLSNNEITFSLSGGTSNQYELSGFNNGTDIGTLSSLTYSGLVPGLNQLVIRAKHKQYNSNKIVSNWVTVDLICTQSCNETVIAVNGVSNGIINNGVAELYHLTVYSPNKEELELATYLEDARLTEGNNLIKGEIINPYSYDINNIYKTSYKKYIEEESSGDKFLMVKVGENNYYKFYTPTIFDSIITTVYKQMVVEEPNTNFIYYKDQPRSFNYDQITGQINNVFTKENINPKLEATDGWGEDNGICYFRATAQAEPVFVNDLDLNLQQSSGFSLEFGFKTYNISNKSKPIFSLGKLQLWPTQLVWWDEFDSAGENSSTFTTRNSQFQEDAVTHITITVHPNYKLSENDPYYPDFLKGNQNKFNDVIRNFSFNLVRIYIDGRIDRGFILSDDELRELVNSRLKLNPTTADIDIYLFRVYNTIGLADTYVQRNYNSFIFDKLSKQEFFDQNDILGTNGMISFNKSRTKQNTIVLVLPKGVSFPNYTWDDSMEDLAKDNPATMFIGYKDPVLNQQFGGRINYGQIKGQGSSAKRYLIWNVQNSFGKYKDDGNDSIFISYSPDNFDSDTNKFKADAKTTQKNCYVMPTYNGQEDTGSKVKKSVGKVNWASSMQSHKIGACKLYDDAYKSKYPETKGKIGKKAVHEEPYLYFYWETELDDVSNVQLADVLVAEQEGKIKFAGFQTWGAGKGDKYESGYGDDTPEYLMLEGGENANTTVNFRCPWHALQSVNTEGDITNFPTVSISDSLNNPEMRLSIDDESIVYQNQGAWDIDFGCGDDKKSFLPEVKKSLIRFRQFYDFVYKHDFTFVIKSGASCDSNDFLTTNEEGNPTIDAKHKYVVAVPNGKFTINGVVVSDYKQGDVYRYDVMSQTWVPAGLYYENNAWQRYNVFDEYPEAAGILEQIPLIIKEKFKEGIKEFIDLDDIAFHQAFIKFVSGTDNRAKNTYFQIIGPKYIEEGDEFIRPEIAEGDWSDYKIRLIGDDLDTIFVTDNSGLQSKPYNLLEVSYDPSFKDHWGDDHNIFFYMFDQCFENQIIENLKAIINKAFNGKDINDKESYFYKNFFKVQEDYPAVAYNHTSRLYYENAYIIWKNEIIPGYTNNLGVDPIGQIHGSCLPCEKQFMTERMDFLNGYAQTSLSNYYATDQVGGATHAMKIMLEFTPYQDFYPNYGYGAAGGEDAIPYYILGTNTGIKAIEALAKKDQLIETIIDRPDAQTYQGIFQMHLYKTLNILGSNETSLPSLERGTDVYIDNEEALEGVSLFKLTSFTGDYPVLENLTLKNIELPSTLSLSNCIKLKSVDLTNSIVQEVVLPISGRLQELIFPETIKRFEIYNNPGLTNVTFESYDNIENVYIDCAKCGKFDVANFCENLSAVSLKSITLKNINNLYLTEETLKKLLNVDCILEGEITIIDSVGDTAPKDISFNTKLELVNKFGNIDTGSNGLKINYTTSPISRTDIQYPDEVSAFYNTKGSPSQVFAGLFTLNIVKGNNVKIIDGVNPYNPKVNGYLDISYSLQSSLVGVSINSNSGAITLTSNVDTNAVAQVIIQIVTTTNTFKNDGSGTNISPTRVSFAWKAPRIGDYAYIDGTFSSYYNSNKTVVGLVYAKTETTSESGIVYIVGKEYSNNTAHYTGFTSGSKNGSANPGTVTEQIYQLDYYVTNILGIASGTYFPKNLQVYNTTNLSEITVDKGNIIMSQNMSGKEDTRIYVDLVNNIMLPKLLNRGVSIPVVNSNEGDYIDTIDNLNKCCTVLDNSSLNSSTLYNSSLLFPYFYSAYLYEPSTTKEGESVHEQYKKGNWYAPSIGELSRIIYYRGYSAVPIFNSPGYVRQPIIEDVPNGDTELTTPIFSLASVRGYLADVWNNIVGSNNTGTANNIVTSRPYDSGSDDNNYSYQTYSPDYTNTNYVNIWMEGNYSEWNYYEYEAQMKAWNYTKHQGLPFTQFNYSKP